MIPANKTPWRAPGRIHGLLFDTAVFLGGWLLLAINPAEMAEPWLGALLLTAVAAQAAGAHFKRHHLGARLAQQSTPSGLFGRFMQALLLFHFILFTAMSLMAFIYLGWYTPNGPIEGWWVALAFVLGGVTTGTVYGAARPATTPPASHAASEYAADALLWLSVLLTTALLWNNLFADLGATPTLGLTGRGLVLVLALAFLFVVFYLPARYLFLVEDYRHPATWLRLWVVMLPLAIAILGS